MAKEGGITESISPLMQQLENAKKLAEKLALEDKDEKLKKFDKIKMDFQEMKGIFHRRQEWEANVSDGLQMIARLIDNMLENTEEDVKHLQLIEETVASIKETLASQQSAKLSDGTSSLSSQPSTSSVGEGSERVEQRRQTYLYFKESGAMSMLKDTIDALNLQVRYCFFCLAVFPEGAVIKKRQLIYWWIGCRIVVSMGENTTAEQVGEICFGELVTKGLVQPIYRAHSAVIDSCKIHPSIRQVLISAAEKHGFFDISRDASEVVALVRSTNKESLQVVSSNFGVGGSVALVNIKEQYLVLQSDDNLERTVKGIAVAQLGRWQSVNRHHIEVENDEFLKWLAFSKEMGYLSLQGISRLMWLPESIGKLTSLIILDLRACHNLEKLPTEISSLKRLTHLDVSSCYLLDHMPKGIRSLPELQVLKGFVIASSRNEDPCRLSDLAKLEKLRKLSISIGRESLVAKGEFERLKEFKALRSLTITWGLVSEDDAEKLTLSAPPSLEKLDVRAYPRAEARLWLNSSNFGNLKRLYIRGGKLASLYKDDYKDWKVEVLRLKFLKMLSLEWQSLQKLFPCLNYLEALECGRLVNFELSNGVWRRPNVAAKLSTPTEKGKECQMLA